MIETIIAFFGANKVAIGAVISIGEGIVVLMNLWRKFRKKRNGETNVMSSSSAFKEFLWVINPVSLFRKSS